MTMRHLLMTADAVGGVWTYALDLAQQLAPHGYRTTLAILGPSPDAAQRAAMERVEGLSWIDTGLPLDWTAPDAASVRATATALATLAGELRPDLFQVNAPALACARHPDIPLIVATHSCMATWWDAMESGPMPADFAWRTDLAREGLAQADRCVVPTAAFGEAVARCYGLGTAPMAVHNGRLTKPPQPSAPHDCVFTAGRLWDRAKNVQTMDAVAGRLAIPFKAAGSLAGPNGERVEPRHLCLLGQVDGDRMAQCLSARPVFVSAARYEPFGLAVLEAAAAGCALVLSDIPTFRELWDGAALFLPPDDDKGFARVIEGLIGDVRWRAEMGEEAAIRAQRYSAQNMADQMAQLYGALTPNSARRAA
ncbi:glycosyltransferase family 4 protein [Sphingobium bisphenolivorans]|uniref:glycosyltransferase family 4 protein n=1 Tax=Sphingobium bisphenolivorans TaxID=1335760 RepID=UPI0003B51F5B|nr:glycosyltransferase family 4 protein [Sphingobium bisphenolivorans]